MNKSGSKWDSTAGIYEDGYEPSDSMKAGEFIGQLSEDSVS
jgi:hypothetical protein